MESRADLKQAADPPHDLDAAFGRLGDLRKDLEDRALAGSVMPDDPHDFARL